MIEISFGKLLVLALLALIVLGPEKLPAAARTAGALLRRVRGGWDSVRAEVERELQVEEMRRAARDAVAQVDAAQAQVDTTLQQVRETAQAVGDPARDVADALARTEAATANAVAASAGEGEPAAFAAGATAGLPEGDTTPVATAVVPPPTLSATEPVVRPDTLTGDLFAGTHAAAALPDATAGTAQELPRVDA